MDYELKGIEYLRGQLKLKRPRVNARYKYYEMKNVCRDLGISTPPNLKYFTNAMGWCAKSVDSLADRLDFNGFKNDSFGMNSIFMMNNPDIFFDSAILSALISSCCFIYVSMGDEDVPRYQVIDGSNATGIIDPITNFLREGYAVIEADKYGNPLVEAYFKPYETEFHYNGKLEFTVPHPSKYPALVPIIYKPDAKRMFGHSRISRSMMSIQDSALRTVKRSEIAAEFYSFPQKYVTGLSQDAEAIDKWQAAMSAMMMFTKDDEGDHPVVGQFQTMAMTPHVEQFKMFACEFASESGLSLDDIGFPTSNPSSSDAIKASHENLRLMARKAQKCFGSGFLNVGIVGASMRDNVDYKRTKFYESKPAWKPIFEPDGSSLASIGDGAIKLNQAVPGFFNEETLSEMTGIEVVTNE